MRGGAASHLMLADDECYYVVKFRNNPQHPRVLVNELISYVLLERLGLPQPGWAIVNVPASLIERTPELEMEAGAVMRPCEPGLHFGSRYPVDPSRQAVYDYVPLSLLRMVVNVESFLGMVCFDKWMSNADGRQAIFFRDRAKRWLDAEATDAEGRLIGPRSLVYVANMIDHGFVFNAQHWDFSDLPEQGLYSRREVYQGVTGFDSFEPWLSRIRNISTEALDDAYKRIPAEWHGGEWDRLEDLLERLYVRRQKLPELLARGKLADRDPFPSWPTPGTSTPGPSTPGSSTGAARGASK